MAKFNTGTVRAAARGPIRTSSTATGRTYQGGPGYAREEKSELFLLAVMNMVGEDTFHEAAAQRDSRFAALVHHIALTDLDWLTRFAYWLRTEAHMRTASLVLGAEAAKACLDHGETGSRVIVHAVLQRPDEPGELLAYWFTNYGKKIPKPVKRGIADAAARLYNERALLKWDSDSHSLRFADVIQLTHAVPVAEWQSDLFRYAIESRLGVDELAVPERLAMVRANTELRTHSPHEIRMLALGGHLAQMLELAGMTWEAVPSLVDGPWTRDLWEAIIPSMGYAALLRNLRNFDQAGVSDQVAATVAAKLSDPAQVARSKQLPMRFLSAYRAAPSLRWAYPLEQALDASVSNIPQLGGRTLILIDTSGSMRAGFSKDGTLMRWDAATIFGLALGRRCQHADVFAFSNGVKRFPITAGESLLKAIDRWRTGGYFIGAGTATTAAVQATFGRHDRVVILTDEQGSGLRSPGDAIPAAVPLYTWNLAGYQLGHTAGAPNRHTIGGLSDQGFTMIPLLERGHDAAWPF